jgi:glycosyltransferase involved in cell wall biosynthesis
MKILLMHNYYQNSGGEFTVFNNERTLLENYGNEVIVKTFNNRLISEFGLVEKIKLIKSTAFNTESYNEVLALLQLHKPDVVHVHNFFPLISPSVYHACSSMNVPVVQTLHNYRLLCPGATLFRDGTICEECRVKGPFASLKYGCYRQSRIQTFAVANMIQSNSKNGTWKTKVDGYICLTDFMKKKFISAGFPDKKLFVKQNFLFEDPGYNISSEGSYLFVGRFAITKGINVLLDSIRNNENINLNIAGKGPLKSFIQQQNLPNVKMLGMLTHDEILEEMKKSKAIIFPSIWYEGMPMTIIEAFASGKPVIAGDIGAMPELIEDGKTGLLFKAGDSADLTRKILWAENHPSEIREMGKNARRVYEKQYTSEANYKVLKSIYKKLTGGVKENSKELVNA